MCTLVGSRAHDSLHVREAFPKRHAWGKASRTGLRHTVSGIPYCRMAGVREPAQETQQHPHTNKVGFAPSIQEFACLANFSHQW